MASGGGVVAKAWVEIIPEMSGIQGEITKELSGVDAQVSKAGKSSGSGFSNAFKGAVAGLGTMVAAIGIGDLVNQMVEAADGAQKFASTLSFAGIDDSTIKQLTASTQEYADKTVYDLNDIRNVTAQLAANGVDNYAQLAEAAGNLNAVAGGNASTFQSVGQVMSQTAGSGKLMTENWNQLTDAIPGASGALQDAMREAGAFEGNFREAMENGEISADEFFAAVQKLGMQDVAIEAATSTSTIEGALGNLQASVVGVGAQVVTALTPMLTGAMTGISNFIASVPAALAPVGAAIQTALSGGGTEGVATAITTLITNIGTNLTTGMQTLATQLPIIMQTVLPVVLTGLTSFLTSVVTQLPTILMSLLGLVVAGLTSFVSSIAAQLPVLLPVIAQAALTALNDLVTQLFTQLPTYVGQMVDAAVQLFHGIVDAIPQVIPVVVQGIGDLVRNVLTNLPTYLTQMMAAAVELFNGIVSAIPEVVPAVLDGIASLLQEVWNAITSFDLVGAGQDLIQGLIDGVASMGGALIDAIGGAIGGAIDWAKGMLGIASPSKLFRSFGEYTIEGYVNGVKDMARDAKRAMSRTMGEIIDAGEGELRPLAVATTMDDGIAALAHSSSRLYATAVSEVDGPSDARPIDQTINFNQPMQTPAQVAAMMRRYATYGLAAAR